MKETQKDLARYETNLRGEREAIVLYETFARTEANPNLKGIYQKLTETEKRHAAFWETKIKETGAEVPTFKPSLRTRTSSFLARRFGARALAGAAAAVEAGAASVYDGQEDAENIGMDADERSHARVFGYIARSATGLQGNVVARIEGKHKAAGGNALRAGVLGANDGLVSVFSLVMGVAGAGVGRNEILITGAAGLLAGALSMALGEWLSVQSSRELYENQIAIEEKELTEMPEEEKEELALIYQAKGLDREASVALADRLLSDKGSALDTLSREELGIDPGELGGSAWEAAITSFFLFAVGAMIPVLPYLFFSGYAGIIASACFSALGLFAIGAAITFVTGRHPVKAGLRQVLIGLAAAAVTYGIGRLIGLNIS
jgi:VIT1/CCC1 family predicted Fe2+/Mn2+ transporter